MEKCLLSLKIAFVKGLRGRLSHYYCHVHACVRVFACILLYTLRVCGFLGVWGWIGGICSAYIDKYIPAVIAQEGRAGGREGWREGDEVKSIEVVL